MPGDSGLLSSSRNMGHVKEEPFYTLVTFIASFPSASPVFLEARWAESPPTPPPPGQSSLQVLSPEESSLQGWKYFKGRPLRKRPSFWHSFSAIHSEVCAASVLLLGGMFFSHIFKNFVLFGETFWKLLPVSRPAPLCEAERFSVLRRRFSHHHHICFWFPETGGGGSKKQQPHIFIA